MVEETEKDDSGRVRVFSPVYPDRTSGGRAPTSSRARRVLRSGEVLNPSRIGALAAIGTLEVEVYARPRVAILSTGNEIVEPGRPLGPGQIYDINTFTLGGRHRGSRRRARAAPDARPTRSRRSTRRSTRARTRT